MVYIRSSILVTMVICFLVIAQLNAQTALADEIQGCTVYRVRTISQHAALPGNLLPGQECAYICDHSLGYCHNYEHPDCPGCVNKICYYAPTITETTYGCVTGFELPAVGAAFSIHSVQEIACGNTSAVWCDYVITEDDGLACECGVFNCVSCAIDWPEDMIYNMALQMYNWTHQEKAYLDCHEFECDCDQGTCISHKVHW